MKRMMGRQVSHTSRYFIAESRSLTTPVIYSSVIFLFCTGSGFVLFIYIFHANLIKQGRWQGDNNALVPPE